MKLIRIRRSSGVDVIKPFLTENLELTREQLADILKSFISNSPDEIFLMAGFEETELKAFVVAVREPGKKHALLLQVWVLVRQSSMSPKQLADALFRRVLLWAEELGLDEVRYEDRVDVLSEVYRWNFQPYSQIVSFKLVEGYEQSMLRDGDHDPLMHVDVHEEIGGSPVVEEIKVLEKGLNDGISKFEGRTDASTADVVEPTGEVLHESDRTGIDAEPGTTPGTTG